MSRRTTTNSSHLGETAVAAVRLRVYLRDTPRTGPIVRATLRRVNEWTASLQESGGMRHSGSAATASESIEQFADFLIAPGTGIERELLLKSLQEALFCSVHFATHLTAAQIVARLKRSLQSRGPAVFL